MHTIMRRLREDHRRLASVLELLGTAGNARAPDPALVAEAIRYCEAYLDQVHHPAEDVLYRQLVETGKMARRFAATLWAQHAEMERLTADLCRLWNNTTATGGPTPAALETLARYVMANWDHMRHEETIVFPWVEQAMSQEDWNAVMDQMTPPEDPLDRNDQGYPRLVAALASAGACHPGDASTDGKAG